MLEEGEGWKSSFHPPWAPRQLKVLQRVTLGARDRAGVQHCGWNPGLGDAGSLCCRHRGARLAGRPAWVGGSPHAPLVLRQRSRPVSPP